MVQGSNKKISGGRPGALKKQHSAKQAKTLMRLKKVKKGNSLQLPKSQFRDEALDDRALTKAIGKANEQKVSAKLLQDGGKIGMVDILQKGKELNKELRRSMVKKKVGRVEAKLKELKEKAEHEGLL
eukprot:gene9789-13170_t